MRLQIGEYTIPECVPSFSLFPSASHPSPALLGFFDHFSGIMHAPYPKDWPDALSLEAFLQKLMEVRDISDEDLRLTELLRRTTWAHETRHFHDAYCTPAGIDLLYHYCTLYGLLDTYVRGVTVKLGRRTALPIWKYERADVGEALHHLTEHIGGIWFHLLLAMGVEPLCRRRGFDHNSDFYVVTVQLESGDSVRIPCATTNTLIDNDEWLVFWPLGVSLILECLAQLEQESWINSVDQSLTDRFRNSMRQWIQPYLPLIGTFTRIFRNRGTSLAPVSVIYESLWRSLFPADTRLGQMTFGEACPAAQVGWELLRLLSNHLEIDRQGYNWTPPPLARGEWLDTRHTQEAIGRMPFVFYEYVHSRYFTKAMQIAEDSNIGYATEAGYLHYFNQLPRPPLFLTSAGEMGVNDREYHAIWANWMVYRSIVQRALFSDVVICPVHHPETSSMFPDTQPLPSGRLCAEGRSAHSCGAWLPGLPYEAPACMWTHYVSSIFRSQGPGGEDSVASLWPGPGTPNGLVPNIEQRT